MAKLSVIIPSRDEKFLTPTIDDIFRNARGEIEVIAVLDSDKWPSDWKEVTERHPRLHTIHNGTPRGMRYSINVGGASALSRGARYVMKTDAHCSFSEGFDEILKSDHQSNWVVVPRRGRLDPETWTATETHKPDIDYHYLSFPDNKDDFGGPGLNGRPWNDRAIARKDILIDEEMSSQGSCWFTEIDYFNQLDLMDETNYGGFWNEFQEIGLKAWLSGGRVMVNKKCRYLHLHKGTKYGRGYKLQESWLKQGAGYTKNWIWNEAWDKQTLPFKWLIEKFSPVPSWPENWEEILYATRKPRALAGRISTKAIDYGRGSDNSLVPAGGSSSTSGLVVRSARYGIANPQPPFQWGRDSIDVADRLRSLIKDNSLDIVVNNSTLTPGQNPFRGKKKLLLVEYSLDGGEPITAEREEKDWLIIGPAQRLDYIAGTLSNDETAKLVMKRDGREDDAKPSEVIVKFCGHCGREVQLRPDGTVPTHAKSVEAELKEVNPAACSGSGKKYEKVAYIREVKQPLTAAALNDYLIRKFQISDRRLRGPMPIELRDFHRNDLAQLFAELGFKRGAEIGVAEGHYSEVLLKTNPNLELLLVDPWQRYQGNPYAHSQEHQDFSLNETKRKTAPYPNVKIMQDFSMNAVREVVENSLDFVYVDAHHGFDWVMEDLVAWGRRVRNGGIISGDDYYHFKRSWAGVVEAVNAYTLGHRIAPWFLIDAPRSVDFFFVKP